ncbi:MAG TPA: hypothetical protein VN730_04225 [Steroidobacteraceae bacterium]|nr:hypothetical protein [Steroidobacteraceae bacterium]
MSMEGRSESDSPSIAPAVAAQAGAKRRSSRMLENYLGDIEYLLREQRFAEAAPLALALPHICAALAHADLASSRAAYLEWCETWVRPREDDTSLATPSAADLARLAELHGIEPELASRSGVPVLSLRLLRLRRLARAAPQRRRGTVPAASDAREEAAREACVALTEALRRWYQECGARNALVQANLARLAVLR